MAWVRRIRGAGQPGCLADGFGVLAGQSGGPVRAANRHRRTDRGRRRPPLLVRRRIAGGHAFTLGVYDLHLENVVCGTSQATRRMALHLVDLELAFKPLDGMVGTGLVERAPGSDASPAGPDHSHAGLIMSVSPHCGVYAEDWGLLTGRSIRSFPGVRGLASWRFPHAARNPDGTFGYASHLGPFLRGFADQWRLLADHAREVGILLRGALSGVPMRVVIKDTHNYGYPLHLRQLGTADWSGMASNPRSREAQPLRPDEQRQLDQLDIPYFFRFLGDRAGARGRLWQVADADGRVARAEATPGVPGITSDWDIVRQAIQLEAIRRRGGGSRERGGAPRTVRLPRLRARHPRHPSGR